MRVDLLPTEILTQIAGNLSYTDDIRSFRQTNSVFAAAGFPVLMRSIQAINTAACLNELQSLAQFSSGSLGAAKHLTLYHGTWPDIVSKEQWDAHPLVIRSNAAIGGDNAYRNYRRFVLEEASRDVLLEYSKLREILPGLERLTVSHFHAWRPSLIQNAEYCGLKQRISVVPAFQSCNRILFTVLPILSALPRLTSLSIQGDLDVRDMLRSHYYIKAKRLNVQSMLARDGFGGDIRRFLSCFPNLTHLAIGLSPGGPTREQTLPLSTLDFPKLVKTHFSRLLAAEDELVGFVHRHNLRHLSLSHVTLSSGDWDSFFAQTQPTNVQEAVQDGSTGSYDRTNPYDYNIYF